MNNFMSMCVDVGDIQYSAVYCVFVERLAALLLPLCDTSATVFLAPSFLFYFIIIFRYIQQSAHSCKLILRSALTGRLYSATTLPQYIPWPQPKSLGREFMELERYRYVSKLISTLFHFRLHTGEKDIVKL